MPDEQFTEILRSHLRFLTPADELTDTSLLRDYGLDSMATVELISNLETHYQIRFVDGLLNLENFATPASIWTSITSMAGGSSARLGSTPPFGSGTGHFGNAGPFAGSL